MREVAEPAQQLDAGAPQPLAQGEGIVRLDRLVVPADDQQRAGFEPRQIAGERRKIPIRHHAEGARDMAGAGEQPPVEVEPLRVEARAGAVDEATHRRPVGAPGKNLRRHGVQEQHPGDAGEEEAGDTRKRRQRAVERHQQVGIDAPVEAHPREHRRTGRMADREPRVQAESGDEVAHRLGHPWQGEPARGQRIGEAVARQIGRDDPEPFREKRCQTAPGMGRGAGAVQEQQAGRIRLAEFLHVPAQACGLHEAARRPVRPIAAVALPIRPVVFGGQGQRGPQAVAARTAALTLPASAWGSGQ